MLDSLSRDPPDRSVAETGSILIPDPWETPSPAPNSNSKSHSWQISPEPHPLMNPAGVPNALHLPTPRTASNISSIQVLVQDGLKLRAYNGRKLTVQIRKALALLGWMGTITHMLT